MKNSTNNSHSEREHEASAVDVARDGAAAGAIQESDADGSEKESAHGSIAFKFKVANENIKNFREPRPNTKYCHVPKAASESDSMFRDHLDDSVEFKIKSDEQLSRMPSDSYVLEVSEPRADVDSQSKMLASLLNAGRPVIDALARVEAPLSISLPLGARPAWRYATALPWLSSVAVLPAPFLRRL